MTRLQEGDTFDDMLVKMGEGDAEAVSILTALFEYAESTVPEDWIWAYTGVHDLDDMGIYGSRLCLLYKHVCRENVRHLIHIMRGVEMGFIFEREVTAKIKQYEGQQ